jgi:hypothetical protein
MTTLETYQRGLLDLVKNRGAAPTDPYLAKVASSHGIVVVREIAVWWRSFQIGSQCPLVSRVLKHYGCFDETISDYFASNHTSPFVEELTDHFLTFLAGCDGLDSFLRSVAAFERALLRARAGSKERSEIYFDRNPDLAFEALGKGDTMPAADAEFRYFMIVAWDLPQMFRCIRKRIADFPTTCC